MKLNNTETTKYICAAVHTDESFCNRIIKEIIEEEHRVIGNSYGVDLAIVVKNSLAARNKRDIRNLKLALLLLLTIIFSLITKDSLKIIFLVIPFSYIFAYFIVFSDIHDTRHNIVAKHILRQKLNTEYTNFKTPYVWEKRLKQIANEQNNNVIIYGDFSPFVGAGSYINGWSFTVNINKGKKEEQKALNPLPFDMNEIHDYIINSIIKLNLDNLTIEDNLHINGQDIRDDKRFLPDPLERPCTLVEPQLIRDFMEKPTHNIRHYKCIRVTDWNGQLILSIFIRFVKVGQNLFVEASYFLLTPLREYYRQFDNFLSEPTSEQNSDLALGCILRTIELWLLSPFAILDKFSRSGRQKSQRRKSKRNIESNPTFNYGATASLREIVSSTEYYRYFQQLDQEMYLKIIERQIIDSIKSFLERKNIDTSDFEEARSTILNYGVIVSGGSIEARNLAVGKNAKLTITGNERPEKPNGIEQR